ncbi:MAG: hypothetical protein NT133_11565 [Alphaproteobacteria bacterium]|nr:hypothetical protein [Alphaproteobacteria bacterium]
MMTDDGVRADNKRGGGIAVRMRGGVLHLTLAGLAGAAIGIGAVLTYGTQVREMEAAADRAITGERINGTINAVVMDSRGMYMSRSVAELEKFAPPLLANLVRLEDLARAWEEKLPAGRRGEIADAQTQLRRFVELRRQMVAAGRREGPRRRTPLATTMSIARPARR